MKWIHNFIDWIYQKIWWRGIYKRVTLYDYQVKNGRCLLCHASTPPKKELGCDKMKNRVCPCKYNQCLKINGEYWV